MSDVARLPHNQRRRHTREDCGREMTRIKKRWHCPVHGECHFDETEAMSDVATREPMSDAKKITVSKPPMTDHARECGLELFKQGYIRFFNREAILPVIARYIAAAVESETAELRAAMQDALETLELINAAAEGRDGCDVSTESARAILKLRDAMKGNQ